MQSFRALVTVWVWVRVHYLGGARRYPTYLETRVSELNGGRSVAMVPEQS